MTPIPLQVLPAQQLPSLADSKIVNGFEANPETKPSDHIQVAVATQYCKPCDVPPGFKFMPDDKELIFHYLKPFLHGDPIPKVDIHHVNIYEYNPTQLAAEFKKGNAKDWFFITERRKKYSGGTRPDCSAKGGYWKATGKEVKIDAGEGVFGSKRTLDFRIGKQPNGVKTDWIMQEYHLDHPMPSSTSSNNKSHGDNKMLDTVLCKIYLTPMKGKRKAEEKEEVEDEEEEDDVTARDQGLPRPSPFDELSAIFYTRHQETSRVGDLTGDHSLNSNLLLGVSPIGKKRRFVT